MASITKTLTGRIQGVSVAPNGQVYTSVEWVDATAQVPTTPASAAEANAAVRARPLGRTQVRIEGDKIFANNVEIGSVAVGTSASALSLMTGIKTVVEGLISSGKINL